MSPDPMIFFSSVIDAGAILAGFCGTFLAFRLQREANYHRQPFLSRVDDKVKGEDVVLGLTHFTSASLLLTLATICAVSFGFVVPLLALAGSSWALAQRASVVGGLLAASTLIVGYFLTELIHYRILTTKLIGDAREWGSELPVVFVTLAVAIGSWVAACLLL